MANGQDNAPTTSNLRDSESLNSGKLMGFMQENNGNYSSMRLMSFIALITAIIIGGYTIKNPETKEAGISLTSSFLAAAFGPKAVQKFAENRPSKS